MPAGKEKERDDKKLKHCVEKSKEDVSVNVRENEEIFTRHLKG